MTSNLSGFYACLAFCGITIGSRVLDEEIYQQEHLYERK
jgi:hypothetical protein